jgi:hypothetical protein
MATDLDFVDLPEPGWPEVNLAKVVANVTDEHSLSLLGTSLADSEESSRPSCQSTSLNSLS